MLLILENLAFNQKNVFKPGIQQIYSNMCKSLA